MTQFTSESVCSGHPDKICDRVSDAIVDAVLTNDPTGRVAVETLVTFNKLIIAGEITSQKPVDIKAIAKKQVKLLGYTEPVYNFSHLSPIEVYVHTQSPEIAQGVDDNGAGDQGMMFGYATTETPSYMPLPITIAHLLAKKLDHMREKKNIPYLRPDGKTQVTIDYKNGKPHQVASVILAVPHDEKVSLTQVKEDLYNLVVIPILNSYSFSLNKNDLVVNGTGIWHKGGPASDTGVTGRKIIVDTYGGYARVGGGCFSGKDPTKVDRSGAYAARYIGKNIVAHKLADKAEVRLAYFIGAKKPVMQEVDTFGTARTSDKILKDFMNKILDVSVQGILDELNLQRPIYTATSAYGHFGRKEFPWEQIKKI